MKHALGSLLFYNKKMKSLVLSGGGARGAYQVGVIQALADISASLKIKEPFKIIVGASAGAINACVLASNADDFQAGARKLQTLWSNLESRHVFHTDAVTLGKIGLKWLGDLSLGGTSKGVAPGKSLLDTSPLWDLIKNNCDFGRIDKQIERGHLYAAAITAVDYKTSDGVTFVQAHPSAPDWVKPRRTSLKAKLQAEHVMASSAIPILFPPISVDQNYFGDGCVRNLAPCSPAIHLGSNDIMIIGVRRKTEANFKPGQKQSKSPSVARMINVLLNAVLLDGIEVDVERLKRINSFIEQVPERTGQNLAFKKVNYVYVSPSGDIGEIATQLSTQLPRMLRYLLKGLGPLEEAAEVISYLLFEKKFTEKLIEMGYQDGIAQKQAIIEFLNRP